MRCLGVVIYPDGSQAEVWTERWVSSFETTGYADKIVFRPLKRARKLVFAPFLLALLAFSLSGCVHLQQRTGDKAICLVDYKTGIASCEYDTMKACREALRNGCVCAVR